MTDSANIATSPPPAAADGAVRVVYLVRHCQSEANVGGILEGGGGDSPLTALGRYQAGKLSEKLAALGLAGATVVASPLLRAAQTAAAIARNIGGDVRIDVRLREGEVGWMEGLTFAAVDEHKAAKDVKFINADMHGGETFEGIAQRTHDALTDHLTATSGPLILVGHGYSTRALLWKLYGEGAKLEQPFGNGDVITFKVSAAQPVDPFDHHILVA